MKQLNFTQSATGYELSSKRTRKRIFLDEMNHAVPWDSLVALIRPHYPSGSHGRPATDLHVMLRVHFMQQWFGLSDPAMEEALHDIALYREFITLADGKVHIPDETTILRFRHLLEAHALAPQFLATVNALLERKGLLLREGTSIDATLIAAPVSTKNKSKARDPEMHQTQKGNEWYFGMKAHIGTDAISGLIHTVATTAANSHDITQAHSLLHGQESAIFADSGYRGVEKRQEIVALMQEARQAPLNPPVQPADSPRVQPCDAPSTAAAPIAQTADTLKFAPAPAPLWHIAMMHSKRKTIDKGTALGAALEGYEKIKSKVRAKVEHAFRVLKCQFGFVKVRYKGLAKSTAQLNTLFMLANLWMVRTRLQPEWSGAPKI